MFSTTSCCPICKQPLPAVKRRDGINVYLDRTCPDHGDFSILISRDAQRFFDTTFRSQGKDVHERQTSVKHGCPLDCGFCPDHKQHICTALIEVTGQCNLKCPVCYFGRFQEPDISLDEFSSRLNTILRTENGVLDVLQLSGGEPTCHSQFSEILNLTLKENVGRILINTNGLNVLTDSNLFQQIVRNRDRVEIYLQFDGFDTFENKRLRGADLLEQKLELINRLNNAGVKISLAVTVTSAILGQIHNIIQFALTTKHISGITFQRYTCTGTAEVLKSNAVEGFQQVLQEDILQAIHDTGYMRYEHIVPLPCSHENCTSIAFLFTADGKTYSLGEYINLADHQDAIRDRIGFDGAVLDYMKQQIAKISGCCSCFTKRLPVVKKLQEFAEGYGSEHKNMKMVRIIVKNFMDASTFDAERARKCCVGVSAAGNRIIPFCVNNIYAGRPGDHAR